MAGYTVIDVETTGLSPRNGDRIVEIGVVKVSHDGDVYDAWGTLVNPQRDVGASKIHGITARDVAKAPTFHDVAPLLLDAVDGRIIAAHNAGFDTRFLATELHRAGYPIEDDVPAVCTMHWASAFLTSPSRRLSDCCNSAGVHLTNAHSALGDALATAHLLATYLHSSPPQPLWQDTLAAARAFCWPTHPRDCTAHLWQRSDTCQVRPDGWLDRIVARMPRSAHPAVDGYFAVLEMAMLDGHLSFHEQDQLVDAAQQAGLTRAQVLDLHAEYLNALAAVAVSDGILTPDEHAELQGAAACLGLTPHHVEAALDATSDGNHGGLTIAGITLTAGDRVTFTGEMKQERSVWEARSRAVGLQPAGLAKCTKVLVAADPDSLSGKASKARAYGIPIVNEAAFEKLIAAMPYPDAPRESMG